MGSIPVRLSAALAARARAAAALEDRSLTEQIEHWSRLGEIVESTLRAKSVRQLKTVSHDEALRERLARADTGAGRERTARLVRSRDAVRYSVEPSNPRVVIRQNADGTETRGRLRNGKFVASRSRK